MTKALYSGSFDPLTMGHLDIIERASKLYDELTIGIIVNPSKKALFTLEEREEMLREVLKDYENVRVDHFSGLLADYVKRNGFDVIVRGLRNTTDFDYEMQMAQMNDRLLGGSTETIFLMANPQYSFISSSVVREVSALGGSIEGLVPEEILKRMVK